MRSFRLKDKVGGHNEGGKDYKAGEVVVSKRDLAKLFPLKFDEVLPIPSNPEADRPLSELPAKAAPLGSVGKKVEGGLAGSEKGVATEPLATEADDSVETFAAIQSTLGRNVTARFPHAVAAGLIILRRGSLFYAADSEMPDRCLTRKGLPRVEVENYIAKNSV